MTIFKTKTDVAPRSREWFSPRFLLLRALALGALFLLVQLAGLREYTTFLSGTTGSMETGMRWSAFYGEVYILFYLGFVVVAPILVLAAGILIIWKRWVRVKGN